MAGAGYKLFATGDVLTAAEVNTYLQQQVTMVFADSSARTTALSAVLAEGMMSYLQDTNTVEVYNGSNWVNVGNTGDVTEVQAGTGISVADGTGPIPIVTNTMATEITAKGDLIVGTGSGTFDNLPAGTNGYTLVADSVETTGLKWVAPAGGGKVLQVVNAQITSATTISTDSLTDTGITATITPTAATSKILILITGVAKIARTQDGQGLVTRLLRGATTLQDSDQNIYVGLPGITSISNFFVPYVTSYYDSPNTTSATTYKLQGHPTFSTSSGTATFQPNSVNPSNITLLEIGA